MHDLYHAPPFGQLGALDYDPADDTLLCHVCGRRYRNLAQHARIAHGFGADEYREFFGLNRTTRLISRGMRERLREVTAPTIANLRAAGKLRNWGEDKERFARDKAAAVGTIREGLRDEGRETRRQSWSDDRREERAQTRRERNLAGLDRATPEAIGAGVKRAYETRPGYAEANAERMRELGKTHRGASKEPRETTCPRCKKSFETRLHQQKYCAECVEAHEEE